MASKIFWRQKIYWRLSVCPYGSSDKLEPTNQQRQTERQRERQRERNTERERQRDTAYVSPGLGRYSSQRKVYFPVLCWNKPRINAEYL